MRNIFTRPARSNRGTKRRPFGMHLESLESRTLLTATANPDTYNMTEGATLTAGAGAATVVVPFRSMWRSFEGIQRTGATAAYPDGGTAPHWNEAAYNTTTPSFGNWSATTLVAPFSRGGVDGLTGTQTAMATNYVGNANPSYVTALFRTNFTAAPGQNAGSGRFLCDDGCILYVNGTEVGRVRMAAGAGVAGADASGTGSETTLSTFSFSGVTLSPDGNNVFAVELHQSGAGSSDIGFDAELSLDSVTVIPSPTANDTITSPGTTTVTYYDLTTSVTSASGHLLDVNDVAVGTVTINATTGNTTITPIANFAGTAHFFYALTEGAQPPSVAEVTVNVAPVNDAPTGTADVYAAGKGQSFTINAPHNDVLIEKGSQWYYLDDGTDQSSPVGGIQDPAFDPTTAGWRAGTAELGYGDGDEATRIRCDAANSTTCNTTNFITTYFSRKFDVGATVPSQLLIEIRRDDADVIYINGVEVARSNNMPAGAVTSTTVPTAGTVSETEFYTYVVPGTMLTTGENVISVEVHQAGPTSSDVSFDLRLSRADYIIGNPSPWFYKNDGTDQRPAMIDRNFDASAAGWASGSGEFGLGEGDETTNIGAIQITSYYVKNFDITGAIPQQLLIELLRDDGAIIYINGVEVARSNMPAGATDSTTVTTDTPDDGTQWFEIAVATGNLNLQPTGNIIAVEVHQSSITSTDVTFDLRMRNGNHGLLQNDLDIDGAADGSQTNGVRDPSKPLTVSLAPADIDQTGLAALGSVALNANGTFTFTALANAVGTGTFTYKVSDGETTSAPTTVTIHLTSVNTAPVVANDDTYSTNEDVPLVVDATSPLGTLGYGVLFNDTTAPADVGDPLTLRVTTQPTKGAVVLNNNGTFTYTPALNQNGADSFTYVVNDGFTDSNTATVNLTITPVNDPVTTVADAYIVSEDGSIHITSATPVIPRGSVWDYNDDITNGAGGSTLEGYPVDGGSNAWNSEAFSIATGNGFGAWKSGAGIFAQGTLDIGASTTVLLGTSATNTTYLFRRNFSIPAGQAAGISGLVLELLADDAAVVYINGHEVLRQNFDAGVGPISTTSRNGANGGDGAAGAENAYTPHGVTILPGVLHDGSNTIAVEVHQNNLTSSDLGFDLAMAVPGPGVLFNDSDVEGDAITAVTVSTQPLHGSVTMRNDGTFDYTPAANFNGTDTFQYTATSSGTPSAPATVTIVVTPTNDLPQAVNDTKSVANDVPALVVPAAQGVLANDSSPDGAARLVIGPGEEIVFDTVGTLSWTPIDPGAAVLEYDGAYEFAPAGVGITGNLVVNYTMTDPDGETSSATLTITVTSSTPVADYDLNDDTVVDRKDLAILVHKFGNSGIASGTPNSGDLDNDGKVGVLDAIALRNHITGAALSPAAAVVVSTPAARGVDAVVRTNTNVRLQARARQVARDTATELSTAPTTQTAQSLRARRSTVRSASAVDQVFGSNS